MHPRLILIALLVGAIPFVATPAEVPQYVIRIKEHRFIPAELAVPPGVKVSIVLDNQDDAPEEFDSHALNREKHVPPKSRVTIFIGPLDPGRYLYEGETPANGGNAALGVIIVQ